MSSKQAIVKYKDETFIIDAFKGAKGFKFIPKISKLIIPFLTGGETEDVDLTQINDLKRAELFMSLLSGDNADELVELVQELLSNVTKQGVVIDFDEEFSQNYDKMIKLVWEVLLLNYKDSFQNLATVFPQMVRRG